jgi:hypothetical protein
MIAHQIFLLHVAGTLLSLRHLKQSLVGVRPAKTAVAVAMEQT